ncbi:ATP synthase F1 subunit epsilon [Trueperella pecoris]|uniref:ATP synthase epsilon chain n=1 Tax=Trueperella pecoris TaxID=2733571 RepID=A0A7M1R424_9ACTO|nr:ATP synthase F1 subunit epsilon [Trueperella pecoris]QOR48215.1 ATP synthase F1 subunit epsilon [Trueperella pecoris]
MRLEIVARAGALYEGEVSEVVVPAYNGEMGILPNHAPIMAVLYKGSVRFVENGTRKSVEIGNGFMTVDQDDITIVVENFDDQEANAKIIDDLATEQD